MIHAVTIDKLLQQQRALQSDLVDYTLADLRYLLAECCHLTVTKLLMEPHTELTQAQYQIYQKALQRLQSGEPLAYILGKQGFWAFELQVSPATLIPRADTEILVQTVLDTVEPHACQLVADLGTGSGAIACALAYERQHWYCIGTELQHDALKVAQSNAQRYNLSNIHWVQTSWLDAFDDEKFDVIVSNPPYIDPKDPAVDANVDRYEPHEALYAQNHGLAAIQQIIHQAMTRLQPRGWLFFEHGYQQGQAVQQALLYNGFDNIVNRQDHQGYWRVTGAQKFSESLNHV